MTVDNDDRRDGKIKLKLFLKICMLKGQGKYQDCTNTEKKEVEI